jgi:two-component system, NarL family, response regulator YdfI
LLSGTEIGRDTVIKVLVGANSIVELSRLEAAVRSAHSFKLVSSSLGRDALRQQLSDTQADVLLGCGVFDDLEESQRPDHDLKTIARVLLVPESEFGLALAAIQTEDSTLRGVLPLWATDREIQTAVEAAATGLLVLHPDVTEHVAKASDAPSRRSSPLEQSMSPRESEILNLLASGLGNKEIARLLKISDHTVKFHVTSIFNKLGVSSRTEAVAIGIRRGLVVL